MLHNEDININGNFYYQDQPVTGSTDWDDQLHQDDALAGGDLRRGLQRLPDQGRENLDRQYHLGQRGSPGRG